MCANDQTWINVYKQGMNITKLISEGHIYISPNVNLSHCLSEDFLNLLQSVTATPQ